MKGIFQISFVLLAICALATEALFFNLIFPKKKPAKKPKKKPSTLNLGFSIGANRRADGFAIPAEAPQPRMRVIDHIVNKFRGWWPNDDTRHNPSVYLQYPFFYNCGGSYNFFKSKLPFLLKAFIAFHNVTTYPENVTIEWIWYCIIENIFTTHQLVLKNKNWSFNQRIQILKKEFFFCENNSNQSLKTIENKSP